MKVRIGVDVGGTNTDAVALAGNTVIAAAKAVTSDNITSGIVEVIQALFDDTSKRGIGPLNVSQVHIGTTHFVNAIIQQNHLDKVSVIRLCGPSTSSLPPFSDFPDSLKQDIQGTFHLIEGGFEFDGCTEITEINEDEVVRCIQEIKKNKISHIVVAGVFSPDNPSQEEKVGQMLKELYQEAHFTLSHEVGQLGLLERENAAILNETLKGLCQRTVAAFEESLKQLNLSCPLFLTQNDGTLLSASRVLELPVRTFSSGPTNSMRGAAHLSGLSDAIVVDIGGTSSDIGILVCGFPREAVIQVKVGGVRTNFRMPDVLSIGLGGGSIVSESPQVSVGPQSVAHRLTKESLVFGGSTMTATDIAVACAIAIIGNPENVKKLPKTMLHKAMDEIYKLLEENIDRIKTKEEDMDVILVGGGSVLVDPSRPIKGVRKLYKPPFFEVANAVGAALSQVSGYVDKTVNLKTTNKDLAIQEAKNKAKEAAVKAGAIPDSVEIVELDDIPIAYQPNDATRLKVKAVGNLRIEDQTVTLENSPQIVYVQSTQKVSASIDSYQNISITDVSDTIKPKSKTGMGQEETDIPEPCEPNVDPETGIWQVSEYDLHALSVGAGILGCGGGGNPTVGRLRALRVLKKGVKIQIISPERMYSQMKEDQEVISIAFMGAPLVFIEKIACGSELQKCIEGYVHATSRDNKTYNRPDIKREKGLKYIKEYGKISALKLADIKKKLPGIYCTEIGGLNSVEPLAVGGTIGLPVVDADGMGRAFPELQMFVPFIQGVSANNSLICDEKENLGIALEAQSGQQIEDFFRPICVKMGCVAGYAMGPVTRDDMIKKTVPHSLSRAWRLGDNVLRARKEKRDPIQAVLSNQSGKLLLVGKTLAVERKTVGGFNRGSVKIESFSDQEEKETVIIFFQNEALVAKTITHGKTQQVLACTPDLISIVAMESGEPIPMEEMRYGLRVALLALPASPLLRTKEALKLVGPQAFGYSEEEVEYKPLDGYTPTVPVPLI